MAPSSRSIGRVGWDMLKQQSAHDAAPKTLILSPLSITIALGMLSGAADNSKKHALSRKLGFENADDLQSALYPLHGSLYGSDVAGSPLALANGVFTDPSVTLYRPYQEFLERFNAQYAQYPSLAGAVDDINSWITDNTRGLIRNMLSADVLQVSHLALINAIGFKGTWQVQFNKSHTKKKTFFIDKKNETQVDMMYLHDQKVSSLQTRAYTAVQLPYQLPESYPQTSLVAYLPTEGTPIETVLDEIMTGGSSGSRFSQVKYKDFGFPKFEINSNFSLVDTLEDLGYPVGGVYTDMAAGQNQVQTILHQAFVKVDEEGTEAAAATAIMMTRSLPPPPKFLLFNRPFVFAIVSEEPDAILFAGIYSGK